MKFIIFILASLCFIQTLAEAANKAKLDELGNCKTYTINDKGLVTGCEECHTGYKLDNNKCIFDTKITPSYPAHDCDANGKCEFYDLAKDGGDKCVNEVDLIDAAGNAASDGKENPSCIACAKFISNGKCEKCATGYILNGDKCIPLNTEDHTGVNLFGTDTEEKIQTNKYCVHGEYLDGKAECFSCTGNYIQSGFLCTPPKESNIPGCIEKYFSNNQKAICKKCRNGYDNFGTTCEKLDDECISGDTKGKCAKCLTGYYLIDNKCEKCQASQTTPEDFNGDECQVLSIDTCEQCNPNCKIGPSKISCVSKHCDLFDSSNRCIRCEQGYVFFNGECTKSENECKVSGTQKCEEGYYPATEDGQIVCKKCTGKCRKCLSDTICVEGSSELGSGHALNGLPCVDQFCDLCSSENPNICLRCSQSDQTTKLINGRCYTQQIEGYMSNSAKTFTACRFNPPTNLSPRETHDANTIKQDQDKLDASFAREIYVGYQHAKNTDKLCEYQPHLPYYYYMDGENIKCVGKNRDEYNDCECIEGFFETSVHKFTNCVKFDKDPHCVKPLNKDICAKCRDGMKLVNYGTFAVPNYMCGCENGFRPNKEGECVPCSKECATCKSDGNGNEVCLTCKGKVETYNDDLKENNYNRDPSKLCACNEGYVAYVPKIVEDSSSTTEKEDPNVVYACYAKPADCDDYLVDKYSVTCNECKNEGFSSTSGCTECKEGYYKVVQGNSATCKKCLKFQNHDDILACETCSDGNTCDSCIADFLNKTDDCQTCEEGYTLKYTKIGDSEIRPICVPCHNYCNGKCYYGTETECAEKQTTTTKRADAADAVESSTNSVEDGSNGSLGSDNEASTTTSSGSIPDVDSGNPGGEETTASSGTSGEVEKPKRVGKGTYEDPYNNTMIELKEVHVYCEACDDPQYKPCDQCKCGETSIRLASGGCIDCETLLENKTRDYPCDYTAGCKQSEVASADGHMYYRCNTCLSAYHNRNPASNCTQCTGSNRPVEPNGNNGGCQACAKKCLSCSWNGEKEICNGCRADSAIGADCDQCEDGYFHDKTKGNNGYDSDGLIYCTKCGPHCTKCVGHELNCSSCEVHKDTETYKDIVSYLPNGEKGCSKCASGFYYDVFNQECKAVNSQNGYVDSVLVCTYPNGSFIDCQKAIDKGTEVIATERAIRCDTTIPGVAPEPVEGLCVCKTGFHDNRTAEEIAASPKPVCLDDRLLTGDDFCVDAIENNGTYACEKCNADYLEINNGKCVCKNSHYTTSWGACIPCGRHNKGCEECSGKKQCTKCEDGYSLRDGACHAK